MVTIAFNSEAKILAATRQKDFREDLKKSLNTRETTIIQVDNNCLFVLKPAFGYIFFSILVDNRVVFGGCFTSKSVETCIIQQMRRLWRNKTLVFTFPLLPF